MERTKVDTILRGGIVVTRDSATQQDIAINGEQIVAIGRADLLPDAERIIDLTGQYVLPGAIDCHAHYNYEGWDQGSVLSALGGITTTIPFINCRRADSGAVADAVRHALDEANACSVIDFTFHVILSPTPDTDYRPLLAGVGDGVRLGVRSYKMFMGYRQSGRNPVTDDFLYAAMVEIGAHDALTMVHAENADLIAALEQELISQGKVTPEYFCGSRPVAAETEAINRAAEIARLAGAPLYIVHLTSAEGLALIKARVAEGQTIYTETCPQYLLLTEAEMSRIGPFAKIGPPLRAAAELDGLWRGIRRGEIPIVGSDHSTSPREAKEPGWTNIFFDGDGNSIPFGAPSAETMLPLLYSEGVVKRGLPVWWLARVLGENPARVFGLYPRKGVIAVGSDADFTVIDPDGRTAFRGADLHSRAGYTPYEGWELSGALALTMVRGQVVVQNGQVRQTGGFGRFVPGSPPMAPVYGAVTGAAAQGVTT
ncbi:MAG TPA: amidohydrolase family protein [Thermomicrobiaceae bacterium]|nr:amidohydrolase family protein [Thermomicrobiaceae bacterium]